MMYTIGTGDSVSTPLHLRAWVVLSALALLAGAAGPSVAAQTSGSGGSSGPFGFSDVSAVYAFSSKGDIQRGGKLGTAEISHYQFAVGALLPAPATWRFSGELSWSRDNLDLTGAVPLPEQLESIGVTFTAMKGLANAFGTGWSAIATLKPSFSSDSGEISGDAFNLLGIVAVGQEVTPTLSWNVGVGGRTRGDTKVLPIVGLRWVFGRDWSLRVGFPRTGVFYRLTEALSFNAHVALHGGTYYISELRVPGLRDTHLDYQELRLGIGAEFQVNRALAVVADGGKVLDRNLDYYDRALELDGQSAAYARLGLRYRF